MSRPIALIARALSVCESHASKAGGGGTRARSRSAEMPLHYECCRVNYSMATELEEPTHIDSNIFDNIHKEQEQKYQRD